MDSQKPVLVCATKRSALASALLNAGRVPLVRERIGAALETLRREQIGGVLVDARNADVDALEFVLNVRDVDGKVPILVAASDETREDLIQTLKKLPGVRVTEPETSPEQVVGELERTAVRAGEEYS